MTLLHVAVSHRREIKNQVEIKNTILQLKNLGDVRKPRRIGLRWKNHIKKHGYNCRTYVIRTFTNMEDCMWFCKKFSIINNIVESNDWANLMEENGINGGSTRTGMKNTEESNRKNSEAHKGKKHNKDSVYIF